MCRSTLLLWCSSYNRIKCEFEANGYAVCPTGGCSVWLYKWFTATLNQINTIINEINFDPHVPYVSPKVNYKNKLRKIVLKMREVNFKSFPVCRQNILFVINVSRTLGRFTVKYSGTVCGPNRCKRGFDAWRSVNWLGRGSSNICGHCVLSYLAMLHHSDHETINPLCEMHVARTV
jgi:hypothetical protein